MVAPPSLAARVTAHIIDALNHGVRPWTQPWDSAGALALPLRHNGVPYRGFNVVALWAVAAKRQLTHRHWFSFKQAQALGAHVRRGESATRVTFYSNTQPAEAEDQSANQAMSASTKRRAILRTFGVFNVAQIDNLPAQFYATPIPVTDCDDTALATRFDRVPAVIQHGGARACYDPLADTIRLPPRHSFVSTAQFFSTLLHELAHWTGHPTRLARDAFLTLGPRAPAVYAREELVAELTAAFLGAELGLPVDHLECHAAYLDYWLKLLDREPGALLSAASHAQRAADFLRPLLGFAPVVTAAIAAAIHTPDRAS
jgi:antirestriction protein ArdC